MKENRLVQILDGFKRARVALVGDACLDGYWHADMRRSELSRETPHYNRPVHREVYSGGAVANVASNLHVLGVRSIALFTVLGNDWRGAILMDALTRMGVDVSYTAIIDDRITPMYLKPILEGYETFQEAERYDFSSPALPGRSTIEGLARNLEDSIDGFDCVLIEDQLTSGVVTDELLSRLVGLARSRAKALFTVDSRRRIKRFSDMIWKVNELEAAETLGIEEISDVKNPASLLLDQGARGVFLTMGCEGCIVADGTNTVRIAGYPVSPPLDFVGAGDTFHATAALSLASGASFEEAAVMANLAASITVGKLCSTGTASPEEILRRFREQPLDSSDHSDYI
jgi:rfaE bifunctional protein kinase chain/domain